MKNKKIWALCMAFTMLFTSACTGGAKSAATNPAGNPYPGTSDPDMVTVDIQTEPPALNSMVSVDSISYTIFQMSMVGLMKLDGEGQPAPGIAESYEVSDDKTTYTFHLREDARWSNGDAVTADDFIFAWNTTLDPDTAAPGAYSLCENIVNAQELFDGTKGPEELGVKAPDPHTLVVELVNPVPYALFLFASPDLLPLNQKVYEEIGADLYGTDSDKIVTNGAYRIAEWVHDNYILMEKSDSYYDPAGIYVPKVKYVMLGDENARMNAFKTGELDVFDIIGAQISTLENEGSDIVHAYYDNTVFLFQFNRERTATANNKICQALTMSIDTKSLCDNVFQDGSLPADGIVPPGITGTGEKTYSESRGSLFSYNPEQAKKLLAEGLKEIGKTADELKLTYVANDSSIGKVQAEYFQQQWAQNLGIQVELSLMDWTALLQAQVNGDFDFTFNGWNTGTDDPVGYLETFCTENSNNVGLYENTEYDALIESAKKELDPAKRQEYLITAEKMLIDSGAALPLYYTRIVYATSAKVSGITCTSYQKYDFTCGAKIKE